MVMILSVFGLLYIRSTSELYLHWLEGMNEKTKGDFITRPKFFDLLAGTDSLREQIKSKKTVEEIRSSWQSELKDYKVMRKKYLLYTDFE